MAHEFEGLDFNGYGMIVLNGPSGAGKSTILGRVLPEFPGVFDFSVSHTTRAPRAAEREGVDYHFVDKTRFLELEKTGNYFIETAHVHVSCYGTSFMAVRRVLESGKHCLLDVDYQGTLSLKEKLPSIRSLYILILPPDLEVLEQRLRGRGTETEKSIAVRLETARKEIRFFEENKSLYDIIITNDVLEETLVKFTRSIEGFIAPQHKE
eukprot:gnl/Dysnectes_brevis/484_a537_7085.p1 GENE.gnl/Dysnectes_brevis/484_a537_7085~~gnl/Dysnectes_brevis/484_a537_7085.p1  ORF type:complete len:209 (+),score=36.61 gnl/Dysnectes_brevis/484_a537_7085:155-781(+)